MCGLVGVITKHRNGFSNPQLSVFETLLFVDTLRGEDSTGIFAINNIGNVGIAKEACTGEAFLETTTWKQDFRTKLFQEGWGLFGHNRKATRGTIKDENAHPFWVEDKLVLIHNGSYNGDHKKLKDVEVDSHAIAHHLEEFGSDKVEEALQKVNAAYALIWYDVENKTVNIIRNKERPLAFVETNDAFYFASEWKMLDFALWRNNQTPVKDTFIYEVKENTHFQYKLSDDKSTRVESKVIDCAYKYVPTTQTYIPHHHHPYANAYGTYDDDDYYSSFADRMQCALETDSKVSPLPTPQVKEVKPEIDTVAILSKYQTHGKPKYIEGPAKPSVPALTYMPWMPKFTMREWKELSKAYTAGSKVKVIVDDYIDNDDVQSEVWVTGKTLDNNNVPVIFKVTKGLVDSITDPSILNSDNAIFEITIDMCSWQRKDERILKDIDDADGVAKLLGKDADLLFDGKGRGIC